MRFDLLDLLGWIACCAVGLAIAVWLGFEHQWSAMPVGIVIGAAIWFLVTPPIYQWWGKYALWVPKCPGCHKRPSGYHLDTSGYPDVMAVCGECGTQFTLRVAKTDREVSTSMPTIQLVGPQSWGRYRRLDELGAADQTTKD